MAADRCNHRVEARYLNLVPSELFERAGVRSERSMPASWSDRTDVEVNRRFANYDVAFVLTQATFFSWNSRRSSMTT